MPRGNRVAIYELPEFGANVVRGHRPEEPAVILKDHRPFGFAQPNSVLSHCVEDGLQIERRAADHLQHVGGRCLLLKRLGEVACARLHLVEQPHVLDRDHGLVGEGLHEFDQTGRKVARFRPNHYEHAFHPVVAQQGYAQERPRAVERGGEFKLRVRKHVRDRFRTP